ncbi:MaoC/PaaZ C-terminal domain-containing protein [Pseudoclavibacter soli]|uniref:MaoC/PaaZ C-terminal domain-containing protein n=1 Tax=Pseudoclavibacter soli TaxID=452623 RepID=UPI00041A57B3|nr:MaoC/PaaZ C-terminal domain-containing protein [Pseudoclavibacter soli]
MTAQTFPEVAVGASYGPVQVHLTRDSLVRYAGASGDFNPIHYRDDVAQHAGLPGVLAHGMLTQGVSVQPVVDWVAEGDPGRVLDYQVRFTRPVVVDGTDGADLHITAKVTGIAEVAEGRHAGREIATVALTVTFEGRTVLGKAVAQVLR